jgi:Lon protease-like protein
MTFAGGRSLSAVTELGLFPLAIVLLPTERIPLHIFEPRYKELIGECLAEDGEFGLLLTDDDGLRDIGTRAGVVNVLERFDDGRLNIVVEGRERFRLLTLTTGRSFQTGEVEAVDDEDNGDAGEATPEEAQRALDLFRRLAREAEADVDEPDLGSPLLSFELAARVDFGPQLKQELLELRSERARLRRVVELIERVLHAMALEHEVGERAAGNGKVGPAG